MTENTKREKTIYKATIIGGIANAMLLAFKFAAGFFGNSAAMIADAVHSLSDFVTDIIVVAMVRISNRPQDKDHDYGHGKYETLATTIIGGILFFAGIGIFWNGATSIYDFYNGVQLDRPGYFALVAALVSIILKEALYRYTVSVGRKCNSQAVVANAWHHRSDALSSIGTTIGIGGAILLGETWRVLDPIAAIAVSLFIMKVATELLIPSLDDLLEKSLSDEQEQQIINIILDFPEVKEPHNLRTRHIGNNCAIEVHVRMDGNLTVEQSHQTTKHIEQRIKSMFGQGTFVNIHVEPIKRQ